MNHQDEKPIIYLIGARGAGKTTVGKPLAQALLYDFIDTDACVTEQCRMSISYWWNNRAGAVSASWKVMCCVRSVNRTVWSPPAAAL